MPAIRSGSPAPTTVPNTTSRMAAAMGRLMISAWRRSSSITPLNSSYTTGDAGDPGLHAVRPRDQGDQALRVGDRLLVRGVQADEGEGRRPIGREEARVAGVGVGRDPIDRRVVGEGRHGVVHDLGEFVRGGVARRVAQDHEDGGRLLAEPVGQELLGGLGLRSGDLPAALRQLSAGLVGPYRQTDDDGQPDGRDPAPEAIVEATEGGEHEAHSSRGFESTPNGPISPAPADIIGPACVSRAPT